MARLEELYKDDISKSLLSKLNYKSKMEVPYIEKITIKGNEKNIISILKAISAILLSLTWKLLSLYTFENKLMSSSEDKKVNGILCNINSDQLIIETIFDPLKLRFIIFCWSEYG